MADHKSNVIVIEIGTYASRFGFAGDESIQLSMPSNIVFYQKPTINKSASTSNSSQTVTVVGESKPWRYKDVQISPLVRDFNVRSWEGIEQMILHAMEDWLCVRTDDNPALLVEPPFAKRSRREKFSELLFEKFKVPGLMMYKDAALTCFARGRTTGMVVDMGEEFTRCCGVIDGFVSRESVSFQRFGGARLSDLYIDQCLSPFLQSQDVKTVLPRGFTSISENGSSYLMNTIGHEMTEKLSVVSENPYVQSTASVPSKAFQLPDGRTINVKDQQRSIPELLFYPTALHDPGLQSLPLLIANQVTNSSNDTNRNISFPILLSGGLSKMQGLYTRLSRELSVMSNGAAQVVPVEEGEASSGPFLGGSILASLGSFAEFVVTKAEYEEGG
ncbi:hypothetical protein WA538_002015, partial [Blastocystis sp. DL]